MAGNSRSKEAPPKMEVFDTKKKKKHVHKKGTKRREAKGLSSLLCKGAVSFFALSESFSEKEVNHDLELEE